MGVSHWHCMKVVGYAGAKELCNVPHPTEEDSRRHAESSERIQAAPGRLHERLCFGRCSTDEEIAAAVESAIAFAKASPLPNPEDALTDVFAP